MSNNDNSTQSPQFDFQIASYGIDGEHPLTSCTVIATYKGMILDIQTTCKLHRPSLNCETYTQYNISDEDEALMIDKAENWLIDYCKKRFVSVEDKKITDALHEYEVLQDTSDDSYVILLHDNSYINVATSPYSIPYLKYLVDDKEELESLSEDPDCIKGFLKHNNEW